MSPVLMTLSLLVATIAFVFQIRKKTRLMLAKATPMRPLAFAPWAGLKKVIVEVLGHQKLYQVPRAGFSHHVMFLGFSVLLLRTVILLGRAYDPGFQGIGLAPSQAEPWALGSVYQSLREYAVLGVLLAVAYFASVRLAASVRGKAARWTESREAWLILGMIAAMMVTDLLYDGSAALLAARASGPGEDPELALGVVAYRDFVLPFGVEPGALSPLRTPGSALAQLGLARLSRHALLSLGYASYMIHVGLLLIFLNLLPNSKHFHILLALPNLILGRAPEDGGAPTLARSVEELFEKVELATESKDAARVIGRESIEQWNPKQRLELFACTECGRCTSHCPAALTHKSLNPRNLTLALREHLKAEAPRLMGKQSGDPVPLVPLVLEAKSIWACTTCRACEEQCPVGVTYLDTILGLRQNLVLMRGEAPPELHRAFDGMERNHNPWNFPKEERGDWAAGLQVPLLKDVEEVEYLYWVGCAASYDERGKATARALVSLLRKARVTFAILGAEERCTGDSARRAGNELLFLQLAEANIALLNRYQQSGRYKRIVTTCPHCLQALGREYRELGGNYEVVHHTQLFEQWLTSGKLKVSRPVPQAVTYHDPCTLARYAKITGSPRRVISELTRLPLREPSHSGRQTLCCGAGGAQMWMEEQNLERMGTKRAAELLATGAKQVVSTCPFCASMLGDAVKAAVSSTTSPTTGQVRDLAELLDEAVGEAPSIRG